MMSEVYTIASVLLLLAATATAQTAQPSPAPTMSQITQSFITVDSPVVVLQHVRVIDGTGSGPVDDQSITIQNGVIQALGPTASISAPSGARVIDMSGRTVIPGLVGMHDHLFYPAPTGRGRLASDGVFPMYTEMAFSFPRLYLAAGVTTIRTTGSLEPYADQEIKSYIDSGRTPGPEIYLTAPYLNGSGGFSLQMHSLSGPEDAIRNVNYWADEGFTSYKAYMQITRSELGAAIKAAHARGLKVTGHLCSVTFREAAELGIDDLEHGLEVDTDFVHGKDADTCPRSAQQSLLDLDVQGEPLRSLIDFLVQHKVAVTSTLPVFEAGAPNRPPLQMRFLEVLSLPSRTDYLIARAHADESGANSAVIFKKEEAFELAFAKAGGVLLAGLDPTGNGGVVAGFGDQREVELLVDAGFTPLEAIHIATENGAKFLGDEKIGTLKVGKQADIVVIKGDPSRKIDDIENVEIVFKDGKGYDSQKLIDSVRGLVGYR
jgi:imidazolonepropionase-like amidohydrolase